MRTLVSIAVIAATAELLMLGQAITAAAQSSGGPYRIDSAVIAAGGGAVSGGSFQLRGSFGQPLVKGSGAAGYQLDSGFVGVDDNVFHNGFEFH